MAEEFNADFGNEETHQEQAKPAAEVTNPPAQPAQAPQGQAEDFVFDMSDLKGPGVEVIDLGKNVSRLPVERMKFTTTAPALISIVAPNAVATKTHYREGKGSYFCLGAGKKCCEIDGLPRVKYVFPIVVYDVDAEYNLRSSKLQYRVLVVGQEQYQAIANIGKLNGPINAMDLAVQCSDDKYQKCTYTFAGPCRYRKGQKSFAAVKQFWTENAKNLLLPVASEWSLDKILNKQPSDEPTPVETAGKVDFEKVFD